MPPYFVAVDLGGTQIRAALCDANGQMLRRVANLTHAHEGPDPVLGRIYHTMEQAMEGISPDDIVGIGIGAPGPLNPHTGVVREAPNLPGWYDVPLRALVAERFGRPTFLGNDANLAALAEYLYGAAQGVRDMIYLTISTGIGSGIVLGGRLLLGVDGLAAEAGHIVIDPEGPVCGCGQRGHLEAFSAGPGITRYVLERIRAGEGRDIVQMVGGDIDRIDARLINEAGRAGNALALDAYRRAGHYLGIGICDLLHLFNPQVIVLGGSVTKAGPLLFDPMWQTIRTLALPQYLEHLSIVEAALGDDVGLLGALALVTTRLDGSQP